MIQSKKDNKWAFIVHQNFGDRITVVRTMEIRDPENWELVIRLEESFAPHDTPEIKKAVRDLHEILCGNNWYQTIGIGNKELFIYTTKKKHPKPYTEFGGVPVTYRYVGEIKPA
jgi:hypothetical protein